MMRVSISCSQIERGQGKVKIKTAGCNVFE